MPTTGNNLLPYPNTSDEPNVPKAISDLASAVDTAIGGGGRIYQTLAALQAVPSAQLFEGMRAFVVSDPVSANNTEWVFRSQAWSMVSPRFYFFTSVVQPSSTGSYAVLLVAEADLTAKLGKVWDGAAMSACAMNSDAIGLTNVSLDHNTSGINLRCNVSNTGAKRLSVVVFDFS